VTAAWPGCLQRHILMLCASQKQAPGCVARASWRFVSSANGPEVACTSRQLECRPKALCLVCVTRAQLCLGRALCAGAQHMPM